jgi:hypothetical protein
MAKSKNKPVRGAKRDDSGKPLGPPASPHEALTTEILGYNELDVDAPNAATYEGEHNYETANVDPDDMTNDATRENRKALRTATESVQNTNYTREEILVHHDSTIDFHNMFRVGDQVMYVYNQVSEGVSDITIKLQQIARVKQVDLHDRTITVVFYTKPETEIGKDNYRTFTARFMCF